MNMILRLLTLWVLVSVSVAQAQQTPTQTIIRDGVGDTTQQNVTNGNSHVNVGRINDAVPLMGAGTTGTGSPRVTEASDSQLSQGVGATGDAAATAGGTGSINAKLRLLTDLVNQVLTELGQKTEPANTQAISAASLPLPTGAATAANQDGIIKDGSGDTTQANVVGGRLQVENYNANLAADNSANSTSKVPVLPCTATAAAPSYTEGRQVPCSSDLSGNRRVTVSSLPALPTGSNTIGALTANQSVNTNQVGGNAISTGAGNTGTGVQRVIEATDSQLSAGVGATGDAAASAGGTGSLTAKLRLITSQLDTLNTAISSLLTSSQLVDDDQTGASVHYRTSAGTTEDEHEVKGSAGRLFSITATNTNAAVRYLRCANQVAASTTPGTTTVFLGLAIPGATTGAGFTTTFGPTGIAFSTGLTCWLVTGAADSDVAEVAANEIKVNYVYK